MTDLRLAVVEPDLLLQLSLRRARVLRPPPQLILLVMAGLLIRRRGGKVCGDALVDEKQG
ncbi:MAG TPA: hypothetical protein VHF70_06085 [Rubrobacteraceae bacterium]|nr:hypothetical protein [Rubrobacteraceae bacterium]